VRKTKAVQRAYLGEHAGPFDRSDE
jgi:hypothetical protein